MGFYPDPDIRHPVGKDLLIVVNDFLLCILDLRFDVKLKSEIHDFLTFSHLEELEKLLYLLKVNWNKSNGN